MEHTVGSVQLADALKPRVMSASSLAEKLGVTQQAVSDWVNGRSKPRRELMARVEDLLGIPMRAWTEKVEAEPTEAA